MRTDPVGRERRLDSHSFWKLEVQPKDGMNKWPLPVLPGRSSAVARDGELTFVQEAAVLLASF